MLYISSIAIYSIITPYGTLYYIAKFLPNTQPDTQTESTVTTTTAIILPLSEQLRTVKC